MFNNNVGNKVSESKLHMILSINWSINQSIMNF